MDLQKGCAPHWIDSDIDKYINKQLQRYQQQKKLWTTNHNHICIQANHHRYNEIFEQSINHSVLLIVWERMLCNLHINYLCTSLTKFSLCAQRNDFQLTVLGEKLSGTRVTITKYIIKLNSQCRIIFFLLLLLSVSKLGLERNAPREGDKRIVSEANYHNFPIN